MKSIRNLLVIILLLGAPAVFARGGDDAGNGGFAYKQSVIILKTATASLEEKIRISTLKDLVDFPNRRQILEDTLGYEDLDKFSKKNQTRGGRKLAMNYIVNPATVIILKPYFEAFAGKTDSELEDATLEVQKRLLHEASHIWGYNEEAAEKFSIAFLKELQVGEKRPTNQIEIKSDFCSCQNGKSDLIGDCDSFCAKKPATSSPILYLDTILGPDISSNSKLGNLYNWCNAQLRGDATSPQCFLSATDGVTEINNIPVNIVVGSNSLSANIQSLAPGRTYILKIIEGKTGSNAQSREFQLRRKERTSNPPDRNGALRISPINQYTCINYGGRVDSRGDISRDSYARTFYYFAGNETPPPMPPAKSGSLATICHDEQLYPGNDSALYPRLELRLKHLSAWDKGDSRFIEDSTGKLKINKILEEKLFNEYGISATLDIFKLIKYPIRPSVGLSTSNPLAYYMVPFIVENSGRSVCPSGTDYNDNKNPLFLLLKYYIGDTEGLYLAEKEAEIINDGNNQKIIYGTMFTNETILKKYGFYIEDGLKVRANKDDLHSRTIYYYWPLNDIEDPLIQRNRKLFTVKNPDQLNDDIQIGISTTPRTSDKRIGCVPKGGI